MGLEISRRKTLFPFYQLGAHTRSLAPSPTPTLLSSQLPLAADFRQRCVSSLICLAATAGGLAWRLITHRPSPAVAGAIRLERELSLLPPPATNFKGTGGQGRYHWNPFWYDKRAPCLPLWFLFCLSNWYLKYGWALSPEGPATVLKPRLLFPPQLEFCSPVCLSLPVHVSLSSSPLPMTKRSSQGEGKPGPRVWAAVQRWGASSAGGEMSCWWCPGGLHSVSPSLCAWNTQRFSSVYSSLKAT